MPPPLPSERPGLPATIIGFIIVAHLAAIPLLLRADRELVYFGSSPLPEFCSLKRDFGVPCPTCGMTRSVVLTLHANLTDAWSVNPAGVVLAILIASIALALLALGSLQASHQDLAAARMARWTRIAGVTGAAAWVLVLAAQWSVTLAALR